MTSLAESGQPPRFIEEEGTLDMCQDLTAEMDEVHQHIDLLRLATRKELEKVLASTLNLPDGDSIVRFFLKLFADTKELPKADIEAAIAKRNAEAKQKGKKEWKSTLHTIRSNLNDMNATKTKNTGLKLRTRQRDDMWRWESGKVQTEYEIPEDKKTSYITSSENRHKKVSEIASRTEDKQAKCLLQLIAHQMVGIRLAEIEKVFEGTLSQTGLMELIERTNTETLAQINAKIHIRNGVAIIGPQNPHWESAVGEPILIGDKTDSIMELARRRKAGTSAKIRNALLNKETPEQTIARLEKEISALKEALAKAEAASTPEAIAAKTEEAVRKAVQTLTQRIEELTEQLTAATAQIKDLATSLDSVERTLQNEKALRQKAERDALRAEEARAELRRRVDPTSKTESQITATLRDQLTAALRGKNQAEERALRAEGKIDSLTRQLRELQTAQIDPKDLANLRQQANEASSLKDETKILKTRVAGLEGTNRELQNSATSLRTLSQSLSDQLDETKRSTADLAATNKELQELLDSLTAPSSPQTTGPAAPTITEPTITESATTPSTATQAAISPTTTDPQPPSTTIQHAIPDTTTAKPSSVIPPSPSTSTISQRPDQPVKPTKPPESTSPIKELETAKTFETPEALKFAVTKAIVFGSSLDPKGIPKGTRRRIKHALIRFKNLPPSIGSKRNELLQALEDMKGQGEVIPHSEIQKFLEATEATKKPSVS